MNNKSNFLRALAALAVLVFLVSGCGKMRMARHEKRADAFFAAGNLSGAEVEYLNALRFSRTNAHVIARLGTIYFQQGCVERAFPLLSQASGVFTNDIDLRVKLAAIYIEAGEFEKARDEAGFILDKSPTNAEAPDLMAEAVTSLDQLNQFKKRLNALSKQIGDTAPVQLALGTLAARSGDLKTAEADFKRAQMLDPKSSAVFFALGNLYAAERKLPEADQAFKTAANLSVPRSPRRLGYATFKIDNGDLAEGKRLLEDITKAAPDYVPAWIAEAQIALNQKKYADCATLLQRALEHDPDNYQALLMQGRMYLDDSHPGLAVANFQHMASVYSHSAQVQYELAVAQSVGGDNSAAINSLNQALAIDPNNTDAIIKLAQLNLSKGNVDTAITSLSRLVKEQPRLVQAQMLLATAYVDEKRFDDALNVYSQLQDLLPKDPDIPFLMATVLARQNNRADARKYFEKTLKLVPGFPPAVEQLVSLDITEKQYSAALSRAQSPINGDTNHLASLLLQANVHIARAMDTAAKTALDPAHINLANVPAAHDDAAQAEAELLNVIGRSPDLTTAHIMLAQLYTAEGKAQTAISRLTELTAKTNSAPLLVQLGRIYDGLSNYTAAADSYQKALAVSPDYGPIINDLAYLYSERLGQLDKAYALAQKARQLLPDDPSTADTLAWVLYQRGDYNGALPLLNASAAGSPNEPEIQFHLGMTHYMLGDEADARVGLQRATNSPQLFPGKQLASSRLALLVINPSTADAKTVAKLESFLHDDPNDPIAASRLAAIYERDGALVKAAGNYEQALKANPKNAQILHHLADLYLSLNDNGKALDFAKQAHVLIPDDPVISWTLGRAAFKTGDYSWALTLLQDAADKLSKQSDIFYDLGWADYSMGRVEEAQTAMRKSVPALSGPKRSDATTFLSLKSQTPGEAQQAAAQASQQLAANANYVPAIMVVAVNEEQQGKYDDARQLYEKALNLYPYFSPAARDLALLAAQHPGDDEKAYEAGKKAQTADDVELTSALGILAYRCGDYSHSAQFLKQGIQKQNNNGELLYYLGKADYQLKLRQESKDALQRALSLNLQANLAADARKVLAELK